MADPTANRIFRCKGAESSVQSPFGSIFSENGRSGSNTTENQQNDYDEKNQSQPTTRSIAPASTVRPPGDGSQKCQDEDYDQYSSKHAYFHLCPEHPSDLRFPWFSPAGGRSLTAGSLPHCQSQYCIEMLRSRRCCGSQRLERGMTRPMHAIAGLVLCRPMPF
jgi:hypothetical protein